MRPPKPATAPRTPLPDADLRRERRRLRRVFAALLVSIAPAAAAQACADLESTHGSVRDDAGPDVLTGEDAASDANERADASSDAPEEGLDAPADRECTTIYTGLDASVDGEPSCVYTLPCGLPNYLQVIDCGIYTPDDAAFGCTIVQGDGCMTEVDADLPDVPGAVQLYCPDCSGSGRRPRGLASIRAIAAPSALGAYFAKMAHDEAAAAQAFRRMRDELAAHGAPAALLVEAERAGRDELRHARIMARRAATQCAKVPRPRVRRCPPRSLEAIARENAVEGCVRETFGALVLAFQAGRAQSTSLHRTLARIAEDETRHAALAWAVARWIDPRLDSAGRSRVASAQARALRALRRAPRPSRCDAELGQPAPGERARLLEGMAAWMFEPLTEGRHEAIMAREHGVNRPARGLRKREVPRRNTSSSSRPV